MTSRERLRRFYEHEPMDRPAVIIRWWGDRTAPTYERLNELMHREADLVDYWSVFSDLTGATALPRTDPGRDELLRLLDSPLPTVSGSTESFRELVSRMEDRGIVLVDIGNNPAGEVAELFGSQRFAILSVDDRPLLHALMERSLRQKLRVLEWLWNQGVGPYFYMYGEEMVAPPLHGPSDFRDFNVRYDRQIVSAVHENGGRMNIHCHGRLKAVLDLFLEIGPDVHHCFEAPPMGDVRPRQVKEAWRGRIGLEGNLQIGDMYSESVSEIRRRTRVLVEEAFDDGRGLAVTPTASPFVPNAGELCYPRYKAMVEEVLSFPGW